MPTPLPKATTSQSLKFPTFQDKKGKELKLKSSNSEAIPYEKFSRIRPGGFVKIGAQEQTTLMCPKAGWKDAKEAGVNMDDMKAVLKWMTARKGPVTHVFHAEAGPNQSTVWVEDKDMGINPEEYICTSFGMKKVATPVINPN